MVETPKELNAKAYAIIIKEEEVEEVNIYEEYRQYL